MRFIPKLYSLMSMYGAISAVLALLSIAYWKTLAPGVTWSNNGSDSGDLVTAAATWGIAHPTGYPTYLLLARLFQLLPIGDLAFRTNLLSTVAALLTVGCVYVIVPQLVAAVGWEVRFGASIAALAFGISPLFWSQAVIAEVYTLNTLFAALIWYATIRAAQSSSTSQWSVDLVGIIVGLALGNHVTIIFTAAAWFVVMIIPAVAQRCPWLVMRRLISIAVGLLTYTYLPLHAGGQPPINWGNPSDWQGFWWVVSGHLYTHLVFNVSATDLHSRMTVWAPSLVQQFGLVSLLIGCIGFYAGRFPQPYMRWLMLLVVALYSAFVLGYNTTDSYPYLLPAYLIIVLWIGVGIITVMRLISAHSQHLAVLSAIVLGAAVVWSLPITARQVDASADRRAIDYATSVLAGVPQHALVITTSDMDAFPLWYYHFALGTRPDVKVIVEPLLQFSWYRANLRSVYPDLYLPPPGLRTTVLFDDGDSFGSPVCRVYAEQHMLTVCRMQHSKDSSSAQPMADV